MLTGRAPQPRARSRRCQHAGALVALVALGALGLTAGCSPASEPATPPPAVGPHAADGPGRAAPRWVEVATHTGQGDQRTAPFSTSNGILQWRVTATCQSGRLLVAQEGDPEPLVDEACPTRAFGFSIRTGGQALDIRATGPWEIVVEEQVDEPLAEAPLPGMTERARLAAGTFFGVEQQGSGTATLYRLAGGARALRLDPFFVTPNDDLFVWASEAAAPRTSAEALFTPHVQLEPLRATAGSQNYRLPDDLPEERIRSIVIWCEPVRTAYAAAALVQR